MTVTLTDKGQRSAGIKPLVIEFSVNEFDHDENWISHFKDHFQVMCEQYFDITGKVSITVDDNK